LGDAYIHWFSRVTVRCIDLNSFDDFIRQVMDPEGERIGLPTLFFPMQRVERIALDEPRGSIPSMAERFEQRVGRSLRELSRVVRLSYSRIQEMNLRILTVSESTHVPAARFLPFFIISIQYRRYDIALAVLIIAALTDGLDGLLARTLNQKTALGAYLDPIADKLLLSSSFVVLALNR